MTVMDLSIPKDDEGQLRHVELIPSRSARSTTWPEWLHPDVRERLLAIGVAAPWSHQREAAELAHAGVSTILATGTASGKSLGYQLPALSDIAAARGPRGQRGATVLYISPTKALAHDQAAALRRLAVPGLRVATHDGDSSREEREWARDHAEYVLTNPDMLHRSLLPGHERWSRFFGALRYVVVDECHHYRGVFGAHVALVLRRLRRLAESYGARPVFVLASATVADPEVSASRLTGVEVTPVTDDGSPRGETRVALWQPPLVSTATASADTGPGDVRRPAPAEAAELLTDLVVQGVRTLAFVGSRRGAETVALTARRHLEQVDPHLAERVAAYRGGYLPEERRELEAALREGRLLGLATTNALELGIDVSELDAVLLVGFPGTMAAFWQQVGRAGRAGTDALGLLVARDDPLDTYLVTHPDALLGQPVEATVFDPTNPYVLGPHLCAAAAERPLDETDLTLFGPCARESVDALTSAGYLRRRPRGWFWTSRDRAADLTDIRGGSGSPVRLVETGTGRVLGTVDASSAGSTVHAEAVYLHQGETWVVDSLDLDDAVAMLHRERPDHTTTARSHTDIAVVIEQRHHTWGEARLAYGRVRVVQQVTSFLRRRLIDGTVLGEFPLDLPPQELTTQAIWWTLPAGALDAAGLHPRSLPGAAHAAEHAAIGLLPLFATCDRWDIGGVSTALHPDTGQLTVFVYDGHQGGAGFAARGFDRAREWLSATRDAIAGCACSAGCPACVQSPKCGNQNHPLEKDDAVTLLDLLLARSTEG